jgi:hypothetical protein
MVIGRIFGWLMLLSGIGLLVRYYTQSAEMAQLAPKVVTEMTSGTAGWVRQIVEGTFLAKLSAMMLSGWTGALLILFGILLVWGCRRPKLYK